ncbi:MAG: hypothetical protein KKE16_02615 [Firmicutes bacterium]|nr:hypothetical protein [Bacillota bacterium]
MKIIYIDENEAMASAVIDELNAILSAKEISSVETEFCDLNRFKNLPKQEFLDWAVKQMSSQNASIIVDHNLDNFKFSEGSVVGADIWMSIKTFYPLSRIYIVTSDEELIEDYKKKTGVDTIYDRENMKKLMTDLLSVYDGNRVISDELKTIIRKLKINDSMSATVVRLESLLDELEGAKLRAEEEDLEEAIDSLIPFAREIIAKYANK